MQIDGITYEFARASDLERDGMSLECERIDDAGGGTLEGNKKVGNLFFL